MRKGEEQKELPAGMMPPGAAARPTRAPAFVRADPARAGEGGASKICHIPSFCACHKLPFMGAQQ